MKYGNQQRQVEGVGVVEPAERRVEEVRPQVVAEAARFRQHGSEQHESREQTRAPGQGWSGYNSTPQN